MDVTIISDNQNALLNRRELKFKVVFSGATPSRKTIHAKIAAMMNVSKDVLVLDSFANKFGTSEFIGTARIYQDKADLTAIEPPHLMARGKVMEEEVKEDAEDAPSSDAAEAQ